MQKPTKKQMWMLGIGGALLILLFLFVRGRAGGPLVDQGGAGVAPGGGDSTLGPTYLTYNNPPRAGSNFGGTNYDNRTGDTNYGGNTYGGLTYVSNPPGNCGGRQYYISNEVMARSQTIEQTQSQVWNDDYRDKTLDALLMAGWRG